MSTGLLVGLDASAHRLRRRGQDMRVRVAELTDHDGRCTGHLLVIGTPTAGALVRLQFRCLYADLGWDDTESSNRLTMALDRIQVAGSGVLVYVEQDGRGHGLIGLARHLHNTQHPESPRAAAELPDLRCYRQAAAAVATLGLGSVRLLTDNPAKIAALLRAGVHVTPISLTHHTPTATDTPSAKATVQDPPPLSARSRIER
ncbi:GTP cyclohydrolase [Nocardia cyriacigeorgica]|uniref:GTP cyclohydrolase n=1 Tax=Nocardia cyriacigeorgica TaxID=135487 RepID=UPI001892D2EE|nr:GTP cyclohydrolase [Nocardia cyriacigeorgica]MBF6325834.1 GTP cyclohydrolase [Nocardia cyriacigeorgica]